MMVANSFDLWQKDAFFSAAEEVQESADVMTSAYRIWERARKEGQEPKYVDELCIELQAALGTAKWQLEEFEKAVMLCHRHLYDDTAASRHGQFVAAIESQIYHVESALRVAFSEDGKQPLRWINLDEDECNDLAMFLSGTSQTSKTGKDEHISYNSPKKSSLLDGCQNRNDADHNPNASCNSRVSGEMKAFQDAAKIDKDAECVIDIETQAITGRRKDIKCQQDPTNSTRRTWNSPKISSLKIVVPDKDEERNKLGVSVEATPKEKGSRTSFWMQSFSEHRQPKAAVNICNKIVGKLGGFQRPVRSGTQMQLSCSVRVTLALLVTIFLTVPFLFYST